MRSLGGRLLGLIVTMSFLSLGLFVIFDVLPGDPAAIQLGTAAAPDTLAALHHQMGLDQPLVARYLRWVGGMLHGDFGLSYSYGVPVAQLIAQRMAITAPLTLMATILSLAIALPLGVAAGARPGRIIDQFASFASMIGLAVPNFWIGLIFIFGLSLKLGWFPASGFFGWDHGITAGLHELLLPALALGIPQAAVLTRVTRAAVADLMSEDFVRTARAKGLGRSLVLWRHVVPNALLPIVTMLGLQLSYLLAGAVLVENIFSLPGMGRLAYQALANRDLTVIQSVVLLFAAIVILVNSLVDALYVWLDPRLRARG